MWPEGLMSKSNANSSAGYAIGLGVKVEQLVRSPLGIIGLCLVLSTTVLAYAASANSLDPSDRHLLVLAACIFAVVVFGTFFYMWIRHQDKILTPSMFRTDKAYLEAIGKRAAVPVSAPPEPWRDPKIYVGEFLPGGGVTTTTIMSLFQALREMPDWVYLLVDIETGHRWLLSRLFVFSMLLRQVRGVRCIIFVESAEGRNRTLLGLASPTGVRQALGTKYPWLEDALRDSWERVGSPVFMDQIPLDQAQEILDGFIFNPRIQTQTEHSPGSDWSPLGEGSWDHSQWLDMPRFNRDLAAACYPLSDSMVMRARRESDGTFLAKLLKCRAPFVALVNDNREFQNLYDRQAIDRRIAESIVNSANNKGHAPASCPVFYAGKAVAFGHSGRLARASCGHRTLQPSRKRNSLRL
jgi:hypothetical protein